MRSTSRSWRSALRALNRNGSKDRVVAKMYAAAEQRARCIAFREGNCTALSSPGGGAGSADQCPSLKDAMCTDSKGDISLEESDHWSSRASARRSRR